MTNKLISNMDDKLWNELKLKCAEEGQTIKFIISKLIKEYVEVKK